MSSFPFKRDELFLLVEAGVLTRWWAVNTWSVWFGFFSFEFLSIGFWLYVKCVI